MGAPRRELRADQQIRVNCKLIFSQQPSTSNHWITEVCSQRHSEFKTIGVLELSNGKPPPYNCLPILAVLTLEAMPS